MKNNINEAVSKFILGEKLYTEEKLKEAIEAFESVIKIEDNHSLSHYFLYMIHAKLGNPKKATFHFKISIANPGQMGTTNLDKLILDTIENIKKNAGLLPVQSPWLALSKEVWDDPGLLSSCPQCREDLKFNPFVVGNYNLKPWWQFWKK